MADSEFGLGYAMGQDSGNRNNNGGFFGGDGWWGIILLALLFGWGGNGNGGFGGGGGGGNVRGAVADGFALNGLDNGIRGIQQGLCDGFYAMNTGMLTGFSNLQLQLCNMSSQNQQCLKTVGTCAA